MVIPGYIIDSIKNIRFGTVQKKTTGSGANAVVSFDYGTAGVLDDVFDSSTTHINLEWDNPDAFTTQGEGVVIDKFLQHASSGSITIDTSKFAGKEFWSRYLGWQETSNNSVLGLNSELCSPSIYIQFDMVVRAFGCGNGTDGETVRVRLANCRISEPALDLSARTVDGPGENTFTYEGTFSVSTDPDWNGMGAEIIFAQLDSTQVGYNQALLTTGKDKYFAPAIMSKNVQATSITATGATIVVKNAPVDPTTKKVIAVFSATGGAAGTDKTIETAPVLEPGGISTTTIVATGLTASTEYTVKIGGTTVSVFTTPAT